MWILRIISQDCQVIVQTISVKNGISFNDSHCPLSIVHWVSHIFVGFQTLWIQMCFTRILNWTVRNGYASPRRIEIPNCPEFLYFASQSLSVASWAGQQWSVYGYTRKGCQNILTYAAYLKKGVRMQQIIVSQLLRRQPLTSTPTFNEDVVRTNILLEEKIRDMARINFWAHQGFLVNLTYLGSNGVHI